jgi:hypothetical protein
MFFEDLVNREQWQKKFDHGVETIIGKMNYEVVDQILTGLSIDMIEAVFVDWMNRLQHLINGNGDYVSEKTASAFLN